MKKIHRFLISSVPSDASFSITDERIVHQVRSVISLKPGEDIALFTNGSEDTIVTIEAIKRAALEVRNNGTAPSKNPPRVLIAAVSIPKGTVFETIVQKLTEIGISRIVPLISSRSVKTAVRKQRLQTISDEALEQCGGSERVTIDEPMSLLECLAAFPSPSIVFDTSERSSKEPLNQKIQVFYIGPEGGWDEKERTLFHERGIHAASLGPRVLRTDTAAVVASYKLVWGF